MAMKPLQFTTEVEYTGRNFAGPIILLPHHESEAFIKEHGKRIILRGPDAKPVHRALQLRKDGYALVMVNQQILKSWGYQPGEMVEVSIEKDESEFGMAFPEEFQVVLEQDPEANEAFRARKPGKQRGILHHIDSGKTEETRIKRALEMAERLKTNSLYGEENYG